MPIGEYRSWGFRPAVAQAARVVEWRSDALRNASELLPQGSSTLPFGNGRSYGDSCLNCTGDLLDTRPLNHLISFDQDKGLLCAEAGTTLVELLAVIVPAGWFLPVSPGTAQVTLGGCLANDVHGKNHHRDGTFGRFVDSFRIIRSSGETLVCSPTQNAGLFAATIGGLGLTGLVTELELRLMPIQSTDLNVRFELFNGLNEFVQLSAHYKTEYQYTVAWLDCTATGKKLARGVFMAANHAPQGSLRVQRLASRLSIPTALPEWLLNRYSVRAFNSAYYLRHRWLDGRVASRSYSAFFYPLDAIDQWNHIYGGRGFHQYQFVVPPGAEAVLDVILKQVAVSGLGSILAILKEFGIAESPGMLSFPRPGWCLALDFTNNGSRTAALISTLNAQVAAAGGAAYPAKDRLMSAASFQQYFPLHAEFSRWVDPGFSSDFWRRVSG